VGAEALLASVAGHRVVGVDVRGGCQASREQLFLLLVEGVLALGQDAVELPAGDVDAQLAHLFQQQRLGDVLVVVLVEDEAEQIGAEMAARDGVVGETGHDGLAVGQEPTFAAVTDVVGLDDEALDDEVFVALEPGPWRDQWRLEDDHLVDEELGGLGPLGGAGAFLVGLVRRGLGGKEESRVGWGRSWAWA